ncbi:MAG: hypothetical protein KBT27_15380 [Prevotellaceae bacterium]|nr:hypothetical protein [Candidatus Faecinaster equi]
MEDIKKDFKLVFNPGCTRALLRAGCTIADIKQSKENPDKSIFVFKRDEIFEREFARINEDLKAKNQADSQ